ncbi:MAG: hypothetical protein U0T32_11985 [Chitinophagales bacterium]
MQLNINTDAIVKFTNVLEKMHKSALPNAVRGALNAAVFDIKTNTMPSSASKTFVNRQPNFFKANSRFENAKGSSIGSMKASVGFVSSGLKGENNFSVEDLEEQEYGGTIERKSFIPTVFARNNKSLNGLVRANARLSAIRKIANAKNMSGKNDRQRFVLAAASVGKGGLVLYKNILWRIDSAPKSNIKFKRTDIKQTPLYSFKQGRSVKVKATEFMKSATLVSAEKLGSHFIKEAERQMEKLKK